MLPGPSGGSCHRPGLKLDQDLGRVGDDGRSEAEQQGQVQHKYRSLMDWEGNRGLEAGSEEMRRFG